ncbi:MAG: hypothetical protein U1E65_22220 [Myxococcota bacterium]
MIALGLVLIGATVGVHVETLGALSPGETDELVQAILHQAGARTDARLVLDEERGGCTEIDKCITAVRSRTSSFELLMVRIVAGPRKIRVIVEHFLPEATSLADRRGETELSREPKSWGEPLGALLDPIVLRAAPAEVRGPSVAPLPPRPFPWLAAGSLAGGAALTGIGVGLALLSSGSASSLRSAQMDAPSTNAAIGQVGSTAVAADVLWIVGAGAIAFGASMLLLEGNP